MGRERSKCPRVWSIESADLRCCQRERENIPVVVSVAPARINPLFRLSIRGVLPPFINGINTVLGVAVREESSERGLLVPEFGS